MLGYILQGNIMQALKMLFKIFNNNSIKVCYNINGNAVIIMQLIYWIKYVHLYA